MQRLNQADAVLGVVGSGLTEACRQELNASVSLHKHMIVMTYPESAPELQSYFGDNLVVIDPANPDAAEIGIVPGISKNRSQQDAKNALWLEYLVRGPPHPGARLKRQRNASLHRAGPDLTHQTPTY